jgi:hypothetical protein
MTDITDDTDEKIRRNLLIFSAALVIFYWLGIEDTQLLEKFSSIPKIPNVELKIDLLTTLILLYLILRYRFSKKATLVAMNKMLSFFLRHLRITKIQVGIPVP